MRFVAGYSRRPSIKAPYLCIYLRYNLLDNQHDGQAGSRPTSEVLDDQRMKSWS